MVVEGKKDPGNAKPGDKAAWNFGGSHVEGEVAEVKPEKLTITSKGKQISKDGTKDNPAVKISRTGNNVVKRATELAVLDKEDDIPKGEKVMTRAQAAKLKAGKK